MANVAISQRLKTHLVVFDKNPLIAKTYYTRPPFKSY